MMKALAIINIAYHLLVFLYLALEDKAKRRG